MSSCGLTQLQFRLDNILKQLLQLLHLAGLKLSQEFRHVGDALRLKVTQGHHEGALHFRLRQWLQDLVRLIQLVSTVDLPLEARFDLGGIVGSKRGRHCQRRRHDAGAEDERLEDGASGIRGRRQPMATRAVGRGGVQC